MRFLLFLFFAPIVAVAVVGGLTVGNPVAVGFAVGFMAPLCLGLALIVKPQPPRKADPAKIARLERELGIGTHERAEAAADERGYTGDVRERWIEGYAGEWERQVVPTTVAKPPAERNVEDCPRPEGCVIAHPCRKCGADRGQACVGDPYSPTFHGAPTFGHKIEGP